MYRGGSFNVQADEKTLFAVVGVDVIVGLDGDDFVPKGR